MIPPDPDALKLRLEDCAWLHRLAASLVRDAQGAEDAAQDALVAALEGRRGGRAWLAGVLRNLTRQGARRETRRRDREARTREERAQPSAGEVALRLDLQQHVVAAVKGLEEPYRTVVVLRHFDNLPPREIARRLAVPVKTVHSRLDRAHEKLRARLDRSFGGDGQSWLMALIPLLESSGGKSAALGGLLVGAQVKIAAVAVALVAGAWLLKDSLEELPVGPPAEEKVLAEGPAPPENRTEERASLPPGERAAVAGSADARAPEKRDEAERVAPLGAAATLGVRVVMKESLAPGPNARVVFSLLSGDPGGVRAENGLTDVNGAVRLQVPASCARLLRALPPPPEADSAVAPDAGALRIEPLTAGELRNVTLELSPRKALDFHGRVVTAGEGRPIEGAEIRLAVERAARANREVLARSDDEGRFALHLVNPSPTVIDVHHAEYGPTWVELAGLVSSAQEPHGIPLQRSAALEGMILTPLDQPPAALVLELMTRDDGFVQPSGTPMPGWREERWRAELDANGSFLCPDLPAGVELIPQLLHAGKPLWTAPAPLVLAPGERRTVTWNLRQAMRVTGHLTDQEGEPVPHRELWLLRAGERLPATGIGVHLSYMDEKHVVREAKTDARGRFELAGLEAGSWWIGPAPRGRPGKPTALDEVAAFARLLEIPEGDGMLEYDLTAHRGLFVRGRIAGLRIEPSDMVMVSGSPRGGLGAIQVHAGQSGEFLLGPLGNVDYRVYAFTYPTVAHTEQVWVSPGQENLVLGISSSAFIEGRIVDGVTGEGTDGKVFLVHPGGGSKSVVIGNLGPGHFRFETVDPGRYTVSAHTADGRFALVSDVVVEEGRPALDLVLQLQRGGFLDLGLTGGPPVVRCELSQRGVVFGDFQLKSGERTSPCVPEGVIEVRVYRGFGARRELLEERSAQVAAGDRERVDFRLDP